MKLLLVMLLADVYEGYQITINRPNPFLGFGLLTIRVSNHQCTGSDSSTPGICLTSNECEEQQGNSIGTCAKGFGVCCEIIQKQCGSDIAWNGTTIQNADYPSATKTQQTCTYKVLKKSSDICFLRLDMIRNMIAAPEAHMGSATVGTCKEDTMSTTCSEATKMPDNFCGDNDGQHVYLNVEDKSECEITFNIGSDTSIDRYWDIKVYQIACDSQLRPPVGCLQYFWGKSGTVNSFNYQDMITNVHLLNNYYSVCIRQESGHCSIIWTPNPDKTYPFFISGSMTSRKSKDGDTCKDYVTIHRGQSLGVTSITDKFCGGKFSSVSSATSDTMVQSSVLPFRLGVNFNNAEKAVDNCGFEFKYYQETC